MMPQGVRFGTLTYEKAQDLWKEMSKYPQLFDDTHRWDWEWFYQKLTNPLNVFLEVENGILMLTNLHKNHKAEVHMCFWDCKLQPRAELINQCIQWAFLEFNLVRLEAFIPEFCRALQRFMEKKLDFVYEGRMRKRMPYKGQLADVKIYSILKEEVNLDG